jgi:hypothetical protein
MRTSIIILALALSPLLSLSQQQIVSAEYFIGQDPGVGNAIALNIQAGSTISADFNIPVEGLTPGQHYLNIRMKTGSGIWGLYARKPFYIMKLPNQQRLITAAEYFIDQDPGIGNANALEINAGYQLNETLVIPLTELSKGIHSFIVRVRNTDGLWSQFVKKSFYVNPELPKLNVIGLEYFIDEDPGEGNATAADITANFSIEEIFDLVIPNEIIAGEHVLYTRVINELGNWSEAEADTFLVDEELNIVPINNQLRMYPNPSQGQLMIDRDTNSPFDIKVYDMQGRLILSERKTERNMDLSYLNAGIYLIQVFIDNRLLSGKWVKD